MVEKSENHTRPNPTAQERNVRKASSNSQKNIDNPVKNPSSMTSRCETFEKLRKRWRSGYISTRMRSSAFFFLNLCKVVFFLAAAFPFAFAVAFPFAFAAGEQP